MQVFLGSRRSEPGEESRAAMATAMATAMAMDKEEEEEEEEEGRFVGSLDWIGREIFSRYTWQAASGSLTH